MRGCSAEKPLLCMLRQLAATITVRVPEKVRVAELVRGARYRVFCRTAGCQVQSLLTMRRDAAGLKLLIHGVHLRKADFAAYLPGPAQPRYLQRLVGRARFKFHYPRMGREPRSQIAGLQRLNHDAILAKDRPDKPRPARVPSMCQSRSLRGLEALCRAWAGAFPAMESASAVGHRRAPAGRSAPVARAAGCDAYGGLPEANSFHS